MKKNQIEQAEKLQIKLDKLLQTRDKKQAAFDKIKKELADLSKNIDGTKLKLFEILQSGSDDMAFSSWAKRKISENDNAENSKTANIQNAKFANHENGNIANRENTVSDNSANPNSAKSENATKPTTQNHNHNDKQNHHGKHNQQSQSKQNSPSHTGQNHQ